MIGGIRLGRSDVIGSVARTVETIGVYRYIAGSAIAYVQGLVIWNT
jgi:hypothetical protein